MTRAVFSGCSGEAKGYPGQTLVLFALGSTLLLAALGLVLDGGYTYAQRREMQNAADAAALAGARHLAHEPTTTEMLALVRAVAVQNGVPNAADVSCTYLTDASSSGVASCQLNTAPPTNLGTISGVRVSVREVHETFVLRAIGIRTSGTGANAGAHVQVLGSYSGLAAPFAPCGINTKLDNKRGDDTFSILNTEEIPIYETNKQGKQVLVGYKTIALNDANGYASINLEAYSFNWEVNEGSPEEGGDPEEIKNLPRPGPGVAAPSDRPNFLIHSPQIENCGVDSNSWKGLNGTEKLRLPALAHDDERDGHQQTIWAEPGTKAGPSRQVSGLFGCGVNDADGCVMILPIVDASGPGGNGSNAYVAGRLWGAFWVTQVSANEHAGRLIANYPIVGDGASGWSSSYTGPIVIRLTR